MNIRPKQEEAESKPNRQPSLDIKNYFPICSLVTDNVRVVEMREDFRMASVDLEGEGEEAEEGSGARGILSIKE